MKAQRQILQGALSLLVGAFMGLGVAQAQLGPGPFAAFPTQDATDGRFMGFGCAGIATFEQNVAISMAAPAATSTFDLNIFDGDTGKPDGSLLPHWDAGTRQLIFSLYADPLRTGSTAPANLIGSWAGNAANPTSGPLWTSSATFMPDNAWWAVTVTNAPISQAPSGNYFYNLVISLDGTCGIGEILESNIKVAASNPMTFRTPQFGLVGGFRQIFNDGPILYPGPVFPPLGGFLSAPTTYDGTFEFYFSLPGGTTELRLFDGDFDFGTDSTVGVPSGVFLDPCEDEDDPDTPSDYSGFPFSTTGANPEGVQGPGAPPDDNNFDAFRRGEPDDPNRIGCVRYEVQDPLGNVYHNDNPSGSFEWEQFLIATADSPFVGDADYVAGGATLPGGVWKVRIVGLDLANLNFWFADTCATRPARDPMPGEDPDNVPRVAACSDQSIYLLGDFVWADTANPGTLDPGEAGTPGVVMELIRPSDGAVIATTKTGDSTSPNWPACVAHNTGTDTNGLYCFGTDAPGTYQVRVAASNFAPTKPLAGKASTTGGDSLTRTLTTGNVLTYDFGYDSVGSLGDRIWLDTDGDGVQDGGEPGINGVTVELLNSGGTVISTQVTSGSGNYTFGGLPAGSYSVRVVAATLPAGLVQTYDLDGLGTANLAAATLTAGQNRTDVDFGYRGTASVGDRVWADTDGDGVQDAGETGINGVTVELLDSGNTVIGTKVTAGDGNYTFANLDAGNYSVRVVAATLPAGSAPTYDLDGIGTANIASFALTGGQNRTDVDFGYRGTASVGDRVWTDTNGNGVQEAGETGINGVTVELLNSGGTVIATTMTAGDGNYGFTNLSAGNYSVRVVAATLPAGSAPTFDLDGIGTANIASFALTAGQNRTDVDFGYRGAASVGDRVWTDTNGNGVQEAGEAGINGVTVELLNSGGTVIASQATAGDGNYSFTNLSAGNYSVRVVTATLPAGSTQTYDLDGVGTANIASFALTGGQNRTDVDFGYRGTASVGDRVWTDTNGDGVQDAGETGINGVTVELLNSGGTVIATKVTAGDGNYTFTNLAAGNYSVRVVAATLPAGSAQTYDLDGVGTANIAAFSLTAGQSKTDVDFGYRGAASVGDRVWTDTDGDGVQDAGETGINGVTVELLNSGGTVIASKVTAGDGNYTFTNLSAGNYSVRVVAATLPAGSAQTFDLDGTGTANIAAFALVAGQNKTDVDFGYRGTGSLGDRVWLDFDADGIQDAGETGINGVTVELLNSGGTVIASQVTAGNGNYTFSNLAAGSYSVRVVTSSLPAGLAPSFDLDGIATANIAAATLTAGQNRTDVDFGYKGTGSIGDRVWLDADADGVQDAGETGINAVTVELLNSGGTVVATQSTAGNGNYTFSNLPAGSYSVRVVTSTLPAGLTPSFDLDGIATANIAAVTLTAGQNRTDVDFGYKGNGSIGDRVWLDSDGDGVQDAGEAGLNGVTVELLNSGGTVIASQVTAGNGNYTFSNLGAGSYSVRVVTSSLPAGLAPTFDLDGIATANIAAVTLTAGQNRTDVDFGYKGNGSIGDRLWYDMDGDGVQDAGEPGLASTTVELLNSGGTVIGTAVTDANGIYTFTNLPAGSYTVRVVTSTLPAAGLAPTFDLDGIGTANTAVVTLAAGQNRTDVDFGYRGTRSVGDRVWKDLDGDGIQEAGEPGINGVTVRLFLGTTEVANTVTAGDGNYTFSTLPEATFTVRVDSATLPAGYTQTYDLDGIATAHQATFALTASRTDVDFGYRPAATCTAGYYKDTFTTASFSNNEGTLSWTGAWIESDTAGTGVSVGNVTVGTPIAGYLILRDYPDTGTQPSAARQANLSGFATATLSFDFHVRTAVDPDDAVTVEVSNNGGATYTVLEALDGYTGTATDSRSYNITPYISSTFRVRFRVSNGYGASDELFKVDVIKIDGTCTPTPQTGSIGDRVWSDTDGDGVQDAGETGLNGVTVQLLNSSGTVMATTTTATNGNYTFGSLAAGSYSVRVVSSTLPTGVTPTFDLDGTGTAHVAAVTLTTGQARTDVDFGYKPAAPCTAGYVKDNFTTASFSNNDGTLSWSGAWIESDTAGTGVSTGNVTVGTPYSGYLHLHDSPDTGTQPSAARQVNLTGFSSATLSFTFHTTSGVDTDDAVVVEMSNNGGSSYTVLETLTGIVGATTATRTYNISSYIASNTRVRFRVTNAYGVDDEYFKVDTIRIDGSCTTPPPPCTAGYYKDLFDTASFSNNNGTLSWTGAWVESDTAGTGVSTGNVTVGTPIAGYLILRDYPDTGTQPSAARQANLSGFTSATLSFDFHVRTAVDPDDAVTVEVSNNGGSTYTALEALDGYTGTATDSRSYNVSAYISSNFRVRFRVSNGYGASDELFKVDWVKIDGTCAP